MKIKNIFTEQKSVDMFFKLQKRRRKIFFEFIGKGKEQKEKYV